jgi:aconitate hydratase
VSTCGGLGVEPSDLNTYPSRRGNHEVMARGTFANVRLRNHLVPGTEGGYTLHNGAVVTIYDAAMASNGPWLVLAGQDYGAGSSRDWAAKGPALLGVRAVLAESFERIHRANLVGMGILPLQFVDGGSADSLGLTGHETFAVTGLPAEIVTVHTGSSRFRARVRLDTPREVEYYRHGGILPYVVRQLLPARPVPGGR